MKKATQNKQHAKGAAKTKNCGKMCGGKCCNESGQNQND